MSPAAEIFLREFDLKLPNPDPVLKEFSIELAKNHLTDLQPTSGYFTPETQDLLSLEAAKRWCEIAASTHSRDEMNQKWSDVVRDFHANARWNFPVVRYKVKRKKKPNIAINMLWTAFSAFAVTKCLVLFFGSREVNDPSPLNDVLLIAAVLFSFGGVFYFAFKNGKAMHEEEKRRSKENS